MRHPRFRAGEARDDGRPRDQTTAGTNQPDTVRQLLDRRAAALRLAI
jgi:hypothetical protein